MNLTAPAFSYTMDIKKVTISASTAFPVESSCFSQLEIFMDMMEVVDPATTSTYPHWGYDSESMGIRPVRILDVLPFSKIPALKDVKGIAAETRFFKLRIPLPQKNMGLGGQHVFYVPYEDTTVKRFPELYHNVYCVTLAERDDNSK